MVTTILMNPNILTTQDFIFMTNGGGTTELARSKILSNKLETDIKESQVLLAHTPFKDLALKYKNKRLMVLGCKQELEVAREYGFNRVVSPQEYHAQHPDMYPFREVDPNLHTKARALDPHVDDPIDGVLIFTDAVDWSLESQVVLDLLQDSHPHKDHAKSPKGKELQIYNSNNDFTFAGAFPAPRLAQGSFLKVLDVLYKESFPERDLPVVHYGKPFRNTTEYAEKMLGAPKERYYVVGDNPKADIRSAAGMDNWTSILVRTGVFQGGDNDEEDPADHVVQGVGEAIELIMELEGVD